MCIIRYVGFVCGHIDPNGTPLETTYCSHPDRYPHEPMCDPPSYEFTEPHANPCSACTTILDQLTAEFYAQRATWQDQGALPDGEIDRIETQLIADTETILLEGRRQGPHHTAHYRYAPRQARTIAAGAALAANLATLDRNWNETVEFYRTQYRLDRSIIRSITARRRNRRQQMTRPTWNTFHRQHEGYIDELSHAASI